MCPSSYEGHPPRLRSSKTDRHNCRMVNKRLTDGISVSNEKRKNPSMKATLGNRFFNGLSNNLRGPEIREPYRPGRSAHQALDATRQRC
ncbi:hypothetical protein PUN4_990060 [Paraburkholderia unamae]|nr:hypothetical protein PUN4_990060 [Paraburkholderia unamae]